MVECLRLCASTAVGVSSIPGQSEEGSREKKKKSNVPKSGERGKQEAAQFYKMKKSYRLVV